MFDSTFSDWIHFSSSDSEFLPSPIYTKKEEDKMNQLQRVPSNIVGNSYKHKQTEILISTNKRNICCGLLHGLSY